jgi:hypothetical protein
MSIAIGSASSYYASAGGVSIPGLEAQLACQQKTLSEKDNCGSSKTPEGKVAILVISNKIRTLRARIEDVENANPGSNSARLNAEKSARISMNNEAATPMARDKFSAVAALPTSSADSIVGSRLNVFA